MSRQHIDDGVIGINNLSTFRNGLFSLLSPSLTLSSRRINLYRLRPLIYTSAASTRLMVRRVKTCSMIFGSMRDPKRPFHSFTKRAGQKHVVRYRGTGINETNIHVYDIPNKRGTCMPSHSSMRCTVACSNAMHIDHPYHCGKPQLHYLQKGSPHPSLSHPAA